jgi:uncharacterized membrane protein
MILGVAAVVGALVAVASALLDWKDGTLRSFFFYASQLLLLAGTPLAAILIVVAITNLLRSRKGQNS